MVTFEPVVFVYVSVIAAALAFAVVRADPAVTFALLEFTVYA